MSKNYCPCSTTNVANLANANLKPTVICEQIGSADVYNQCGLPCGGNANLKDLAACPEQIFVENPYGNQCVKSLAEQAACPPPNCDVPVSLVPCKVLIDSLAESTACSTAGEFSLVKQTKHSKKSKKVRSLKK